MTDRELKKRIGSAYQIEPQRKKAFVRKYQQRQLNYARLLALQLKYMGAPLAVVFGYILALILGVLTGADARFAMISAYLMPVIALVMLTGLGRSERYKMSELEMTARFSLRMVVVMRLLIAGFVAAALITVRAAVLKAVFAMGAFDSAAMACIPYLTTTALCMMLIRRWHSENNIYGCAAITGLCLFLIPLLERLRMVEPTAVSNLLLFLLLLAAALTTVCEAIKYVKVSEEYQWNLC